MVTIRIDGDKNKDMMATEKSAHLIAEFLETHGNFRVVDDIDDNGILYVVPV